MNIICFFFLNVTIAPKKKKFIFFTSLINIKWIKTCLAYMDIFYKKEKTLIIFWKIFCSIYSFPDN
jgi:hypothetical protein